MTWAFDDGCSDGTKRPRNRRNIDSTHRSLSSNPKTPAQKPTLSHTLSSPGKYHAIPNTYKALTSCRIERYPSKVTRRMGKKKVDKRSKVKPFIKVANYNHLMPTRYTLELEGLKGVISHDTFKEVSQREEAKKNVKKALEERYTSGKNRWFFTALRF